MGTYDSFLDAEEQRLKQTDASDAGGPYAQVLDGEVERAQGTLRASLSQAVPQNPDKAAKHQALAAASGLPLDTVQRNEDVVVQNLRVRELQSAAAMSPVLRAQLSDPAFAALAHDSAENLSLVEKVVNSFKRGWLGLQQTPPATALRANAQGVSNIDAIERRLQAGEAPENIPDIEDVYGARWMAPEQRAQLRGAFDTAISGQAGKLASLEVTKRAIPQDLVVSAALQAKSFAEFWQAFKQKPLEFIASVGAESLPQSAPGMIAAIPAGIFAGPGGVAAAMGGGSFSVDYASTVMEALQSQGVDIANPEAVSAAVKDSVLMARVGRQAFAHAAVVGAFDAASGGIAGKPLVSSRMAARPAIREFANIATQAPVQGVLGAAGEFGGEVAAGQDIQAGNIAAEFFGEFVGTPAEVVSASGRRILEAKTARENAPILADLAKFAEASKLRERAPQSFADFVQTAAEKGPVQDVFVDARKFVDALQQSGIDATRVPGVAEQLQEALATEGDIQIPIGQYAAQLAPTDAGKALLPHLRTSSEAMSQAEAEQFFQDAKSAGALQQDVSRFTTEAAAEGSDTRQAFESVREHIMQQLQGTGRFTEDVNKAYSDITSAFYTTMAARLGESADALLQRYPLHVVSDLNLSREAILEQSGLSEDAARMDIAKLGAAIAANKFDTPLEFKYPKRTITVSNAAEAELLRAQLQEEVFGKYSQPARGAFSPSQSTIALLQKADLSTFLHESGHFYLEVMTDLANRADTPQQVKDDVSGVLKWFGAPDLAAWRGMTLDQKRAHHEQFARGFESYLFEGEAPSLELAGLFQRFRAWLLNVYRTLAGLNVELNPEVRAVFGRMLATDEQIGVAEAARRYRPLFASAEAAGMNAEQWNQYQRLGQEATAGAKAALERRSLRDMQWLSNAKSRKLREIQHLADQKRAEVRREAEAEIDAQPIYQAMQFIQEGRGTLSLPALKKMYGEGPAAPWRYLGAGQHGMVNTEGLHPDVVAELFGFSSGDELVRKILDAGSRKDAVEALTDQRMLERYGDLVDPAAHERAAEAAIHNEARTRFVATELGALTKAAGRPRVMALVARQFAESAIAQRRIRDIRPAQHAAAETRAARDAEHALKAGQLAQAAAHKRAQLVNHQLTNVSTAALEEIDGDVRYLRRLNLESARKGLDGEYLDQIDSLLERFDLRVSITNQDLRKRESLMNWVESEREQGFEPTIDPELLAEANRQHYRTMRLEEFRGLVDAVKNIEHLGRLKKKLLTARDNREFAVRVEEAAGAINDNAKRTRPERIENNLWRDRIRSGKDEMFAIHRKFSSLVREMDGYKDGGAVWDLLVRPMNERGTLEASEREKATKALAALFEPIKNTREKTYIQQIGTSLSREGRLLVALNWGNETNRQRVMSGDGWNQHQVQAILDTLTHEEWNFVQGIWDHINTYWPQIREKELRVSGVAPVKVQPAAVQTRFGEYRGGYFPIKYDPTRSSLAEAHGLAEVVRQTMQGLYTRATTRRGHTKERIAEVSRPVRKDFGVVFEHIDQVIHDLTWHEYLIDANRLLRAKPIDTAIRGHYGPEVLRTMKKMLEDVAAGDVAAQNVFEKSMNHLRTGVTVAFLGWNTMTSLMQPLGLTQSIVRVGPKWIGKGLSRWLGDAASMENSAAWINERSEFMRLRGMTLQREISEIRNKVAGKLSVVEASYFWLSQAMQKVADIPTWLGAYEKAMSENRDESTVIALADQAVLDSQGGGQIKDLAQIQRGGPLLKLFTNFYSYFNTTFNLAAERTGQTNFRDPLAIGRLAVDYLMLYSVPAVLGALIRSALKGDLDDENALAKKLIVEQITYLLGTMVGLREFSAAVGGSMGYEGPAGTRFFSEVAKLSKQVAQGEADGALLKALNSSAGIFLHYPALQVQHTVEGMVALERGDTKNPGVLLAGPPKR